MAERAKRSSRASVDAPASTERIEMLDIALRAAERAIDNQRDELTGMRNRAVAFSAFTGAGTAFLVGAGLGSTTRVEGFLSWGIVGTILYGLMLIALLLTAVPAWPFRFYLEPGVLYNWIEGETPAPSRLIFVRQLVQETYPKMLTANERSLSRVRWMFRAVLIFGAVALGVWTTAVWLFT